MHSCTESEPPKTHGRDENTRPDNCSLAQLNANSNTLPAQDGQSTATHDIKLDQGGDGLTGPLDNLHLSKDEEGRPIPETAGGAQEDGQPRTDSLFDDDQTHLSNSSTKPTSFDSKSMASVTTFAMDEKESLRPDDSASVQAVEEDEFLAPTTDAMSSQANSDPSASNRGDSQQHNNAIIREPELLKKSTLPFNEDALRRNGVLPAPESEQVLHGFPSEPDEKLVEAMGSPKDRLLLLQLEEKIISFIKNSSEASLELPPCNSFGRLLAHKLGDYYHLTHFVDNNITSVRLHRTPWSRLPTPLTMLHPATSNNPSANAPAMKIMRRMGQPGERGSAAGSTATSSAVPSKTASESGGDGTNDEERNGGTSSTGATPSRDRASLTREEREAKYQEARERIFRDFPESKSTDTGSGEQSADVSRSSSRTGRKKATKPRSPKDDGFEARSQFNAYYTSPQLPGGPAVYHNSAHHGAIPPQNYYVMAQNPPGGGMHHYPQQMSPSGHGPMYAPSGGMNGFPPYSGPQTHPGQNNWQQSGGHQGYNQYQHHQAQVSPMMAQRSATVPSPRAPAYSTPNHSQYPQPTPGWAPTPFQPGYPPQTMARSPPVHWPNMPPNTMAAGQAPYNQGMGSPQPFIPSKLAHPAPGSFSRSRFSPQSRSFAPTSNSQAGYFGGDSPSSQYTSPHFNNHPRSNSRDSKPGMNPSPPSHYFKSKGTPPNMVGQPQQQPTYGRQTDTQNDSIAKWGTPSHLPPKPPPPETPYPSDAANPNPNRPVGVTSPPLASKPPPSETKTAPFVVSGASSSEKQSHGNPSS
ncbi:R3H domain-containing protein [Trichophyton mentagrophytes]|uniref:SUZ domain-containing protein n=1 Tax=Trichophyton interdigitale (strain MR816) TaxID=1215338 RepID=A0A059J9P4_TRIIM|nr:hypothetical protein H101_05429 [Trichophyton interdigitale H6]KDB24408.1 hypothetical protein H109_03697 [Trichophyton interdigitale MR816]GBF66961.1 R3H domain-containing protein [Trichophyton mentagrophytes]